MNPLDEQFLQILRAAFSAEAEEHVQEIATRLLELEAAPNAAATEVPLETLHREVHSLKGASRAVGSSAIEAICQCLETLFTRWQRGDFHPSAGAYDVLHRANETIRQLLEHLGESSQGDVLVTPVLEEIKALSQAEEHTQVVGAWQEKPAPTPESQPVAEVQSAPVDAPPTPELAPEPPGQAETSPASAILPMSAVNGNGAAKNGSHTSQKPPGDPPVRLAAGEETVRIATSRLDNLLLQAEELLVVKQSAIARATALRSIAESFRLWRTEWTKATRTLKLEEAASAAEENGPREDQRALRDFFAWNQAHQRELDEQLYTLTRIADQDRRSFGGLIDNLLEQTKELLTLPFSHVLGSLPVVVRDLSRQLGKEVRLEITGEDTFLDKRILEEIKDPLIHLVRNAIDHGIETPEVRRNAGKPEIATLSVSASQTGGNEVIIEVRDDGGGLKLDAIVMAAMSRGSLSREEAERLSVEEKQDLIFQSALSTSSTVTTISGRGLGMAIVREKVEKLGGRVGVESAPGQGTSFCLSLPVTLATFRGVVVEARGQHFVFPIAGVERVLRISREQVRRVTNRETIVLAGKNGNEVLPLIPLYRPLELPASDQPAPGYFPVLILRQGEQRAAFVVDAIHHEQEVLVKPLPRPLTRVRNVAGATVLEDGRAVPILSTGDLLSQSHNFAEVPTMAPSLPENEDAVSTVAPARVEPQTVLIAEDSVTSRMLIKNILETAGFKVVTAVDGADALEQIRRMDVDLVVSDVDMPRLDGFQLTAQIRQNPSSSAVPVVLVTSRDTPEDKTRGLEAGANAYIVKSSFDQLDLLQVIRRLI